MANKRYYWLRLKDDFFIDKRIKKLRKIAGGDTYTIIYLKMQLLSLQDEGMLYFEGIENTFAEEIALQIDEDIEDVKITIGFLLNCGLLVKVDDNDYELTETKKCIGSETQGAERVRKHRESKKIEEEEHQKMLQCNALVTKCNTEKEKEKEKKKERDNIITPSKAKTFSGSPAKANKHRYGEYKNVLLKDEELQKLKEQYANWEILIKYLDEYIEMKGYKAKSHYLCIKKWVVNAVKENYKETDEEKLARQKREMEEMLKNDTR